MKISDETLMSFADDELDDATRADVEAAMRDDPNIAKRIDEHRALRSRLQRAYTQELEEVPPERLIAAVRGAPGVRAESNVINIDAARSTATRGKSSSMGRPLSRPVLAIAASLVLGIGLGIFVVRRSNPVVLKETAGLVAGGALAKALSSQLGNALDPSGTVRLGSSFVAKSGDYCRTFILTTERAAAGLACRQGGDWQIQAWAESPDAPAASAGAQNYRTAGSSLPPALIGAVEERISGDALDQAGEAAALRSGWQAARP